MINFLKFTKLYALISAIVLGIGLYSVIAGGVTFAIDFTGGTNIEYAFTKDLSQEDVQQAFSEQEIEVVSIMVDADTVEVRSAPVDENQEKTIRNALSDDEGQEISLRKFETVGPSLGAETIWKTAAASLVAIVGILIYITFTFKKLSYGLAAVGAMVHDFLILVGMYSILGRFGAEIDALFITAVLTTMAFSVHDTIVVFDKIREYRRTSGLDISILANKALTETMVRSVNNSLTIILMLVPLTLMGGESIRFFAAALLIGTISGTYSSPFVATPLLVFLSRKMKTRG